MRYHVRGLQTMGLLQTERRGLRVLVYPRSASDGPRQGDAPT